MLPRAFLRFPELPSRRRSRIDDREAFCRNEVRCHCQRHHHPLSLLYKMISDINYHIDAIIVVREDLYNALANFFSFVLKSCRSSHRYLQQDHAGQANMWLIEF